MSGYSKVESKHKPSRLSIIYPVVVAIILVGIASIAWAQRYELPAHENIVIHINAPRTGQLESGRINILVWNMQKGLSDNWANDYKRLSDDKDVLFLQEVLLDKNMGAVLDKHDEYYYQVAASFMDSWDDHVATGVATASRVQPVSFNYLRSSQREPVIATPKMAMIAEYSLTGTDQTLLTANIHALNFVSAEKHQHMLGELETLLKDHAGPMIVAGDFNTWTEEKTRSMMQMTERLGLHEVSFTPDDRTRAFGNVLDWVFVKGLSVDSARIHGNISSSDHKPIEVSFSLAR